MKRPRCYSCGKPANRLVNAVTWQGGSPYGMQIPQCPDHGQHDEVMEWYQPPPIRERAWQAPQVSNHHALVWKDAEGWAVSCTVCPFLGTGFFHSHAMRVGQTHVDYMQRFPNMRDLRYRYSE